MREPRRRADPRRRRPVPQELSDDQPTASDMLGLNDPAAYARHTRSEAVGAAEPDDFVEIKSRYLLYDNNGDVLIQADSLRGLVWKALRRKLGRIVLGE